MTSPPFPSLVAVERNADWSQWAILSRSLPDVIMLVQEPRESGLAFQKRLLQCVQEAEGKFTRLILLRGARCDLEPLSAAFMALVAQHTSVALQVYPNASA